MPITNNTTAPLFAVVGATGQQGGSVVEAIKSSSNSYRVRGFTRDPSKPAAVTLAQDGVEVVGVDLSVNNLEGVRAAFNGVDIAFIVTAFWEHMDPQREITEAKAMIEAAELGGAKRIIWSGLRSLAKASNGKYTTVAAFEGKAHVTEWAQERFATKDVAFVTVEAGWYAQAWTSDLLRLLRKLPDSDAYVVSMPAPAKMRAPIIDIRDYGKYVRAAVEDPAYKEGGEIFTGVSDDVSYEQVIQDVAKASGKTIIIPNVDFEVLKKAATDMGYPEVLVQMLHDTFSAWHEFGYYGGKPVTQIKDKLTTWKEFVESVDWSKISFPE